MRDQYGFAVGGPIIKNRTFFFVDFEKTRQRDPVNIEGIVPTDLERAGDFSQSLANLPDPSNPDTRQRGHLRSLRAEHGPELRVSARAIFGRRNSEQDSTRANIDPIGQAILNLYPHANVPDAVYPDPNFRTVTLSTAPAWQFDVKTRSPDHRQTQDQWPLQPSTQ